MYLEVLDAEQGVQTTPLMGPSSSSSSSPRPRFVFLKQSYTLPPSEYLTNSSTCNGKETYLSKKTNCGLLPLAKHIMCRIFCSALTNSENRQVGTKTLIHLETVTLGVNRLISAHAMKDVDKFDHKSMMKIILFSTYFCDLFRQGRG